MNYISAHDQALTMATQSHYRDGIYLDVLGHEGQHGYVAEVNRHRPEANDNARRLVAAWNVCAGIDTAMLESTPAGGIRAELTHCEYGRAQLLVLLAEAERFISGFEGDELQDESVDDLLVRMRQHTMPDAATADHAAALRIAAATDEAPELDAGFFARAILTRPGESLTANVAAGRLAAEARELLANATFADGQGIVLTQDAEALEAALAPFAAADSATDHTAGPNPLTGDVQMPAELAREGYRLEYGDPGTGNSKADRYWFTLCRGGEVESGDDWARAEIAIDEASKHCAAERARGADAFKA